jgi:hypothetical protein
MKVLVLCAWLLGPVTLYAAEVDAPPAPSEEPKLYDHYLYLKRMQEGLAGRSLEDQAKLRPQIQRAQRMACERLRKDDQEQIAREQYGRQGGDEFLVFSLELEQWCQTTR